MIRDVGRRSVFVSFERQQENVDEEGESRGKPRGRNGERDGKCRLNDDFMRFIGATGKNNRIHGDSPSFECCVSCCDEFQCRLTPSCFEEARTRALLKEAVIVHSHAVDDAMIHLCAREGIECIIRIEPRKSGIVRRGLGPSSQ
jgi:hypothetical protein